MKVFLFKQFMRSIVFFICLFLFACNNNGERFAAITSSMRIAFQKPDRNDSIVYAKINKGTSPKTKSKSQLIKAIDKEERGIDLIETGSSGVNIVQLEIPKDVLLKVPDTIKTYIKCLYLNSVRSFPRSIACNWEKGTSTEYISYLKLHYEVQIFNSRNSKKPYEVRTHIAFMSEAEKVVVE